MQEGKQNCRHFSYMSCFLNYTPMALLINYPPWLSDLEYVFNYASCQTCNSLPQTDIVSMSKKYLPKSRQRQYYTTGFELKSCAHTHQRDFMTSEKSWLYSQIPWAEFYVSSNNTWHCICYRGVRTFWASCTAWDWKTRTLYHLRCAKVKSETKNKVVVQERVNYLFCSIHYFWNDKTHKKF